MTEKMMMKIWIQKIWDSYIIKEDISFLNFLIFLIIYNNLLRSYL